MNSAADLREPPVSKVRLIVVDDLAVVRAGLCMLIQAQPDMEVIGDTENGHRAIAMAEALNPDIVIMDISMPELNGLKATEKLHLLKPQLKILTLTRHMDNSYLQEMLKAGASGYVLKQSAAEELVRAIRAVFAGQRYLDSALSDQLVERVIGKQSWRGSAAETALSPREEEVVRYIARGFLSKEIAGQLDISIKTVEAHKANAMQKLGMKSRIDIVRYALLRGWMEDA